MNKRIPYIAAGVAALLILAVLVWRALFGGGASSDDTVYVETVAALTGQSASVGMVNRFSGVVESQESWSVTKDEETAIEELYVSVGDEVSEGDPLFTYNTEKYESDLAQAQIDLERLNNEYASIEDTIEELQKEMKSASSSQKASYTIQIEDEELQLKDKELDIRLKNNDIEKLQNNIDNATVYSGLDGVIKSINDGSTSYSSGSDADNAYITVIKVGDYRIKGTVNEQNIGQLTIGSGVIVHSRVNDQVWYGTIDAIDTENGQSSENSMYSGGSSDASSTSFPFYVTLEDSSGLMLGQHVYLEQDYGQEVEESGESADTGAGSETGTASIWIGQYMIDETDPDHPFVWIDRNGKLARQNVTLGERDDDLYTVEVVDGLTYEDSIAIPSEELREGMKTVPMTGDA